MTHSPKLKNVIFALLFKALAEPRNSENYNFQSNFCHTSKLKNLIFPPLFKPHAKCQNSQIYNSQSKTNSNILHQYVLSQNSYFKNLLLPSAPRSLPDPRRFKTKKFNFPAIIVTPCQTPKKSKL